MQVHTPFGGAQLFPLQAAVCAPLDPSAVLHIASTLLHLGASPNVCWWDVGGCHTPLSKVLCLQNLPLAQLLAAHGADCTTALLHTSLLERSRFDPHLISWLLDRGADVATPLQRSPDAGSASCCGPGVAAAGSGVPAGKADASHAVPAVGVLLDKLRRELHVSRQLSKLHAAAGSGQEAWLLRRAAGCLQRLLAAGAAPVGTPDPSGVVAAAVAGIHPADWAAIQEYATQPPQWSPATHHLFTRSFREAARQVLLVARRGFCLPMNAGPKDGSGAATSSGACSPAGPAEGRQQGVHAADVACGCCGEVQTAPAPQQQRAEWWLDGGVVLCIIKHMAPSAQLQHPQL